MRLSSSGSTEDFLLTDRDVPAVWELIPIKIEFSTCIFSIDKTQVSYNSLRVMKLELSIHIQLNQSLRLRNSYM